MIKEKKTGQLIVISSPSGGGKGSVISGLLEDGYRFQLLQEQLEKMIFLEKLIILLVKRNLKKRFLKIIF